MPKKKGPRSNGEHVPDPDYQVGYGRPPKGSQFKPGRSGNPKGRPKGSKDVNDILHRALSRKVVIREEDKCRTASALEAIVLKHVSKALQGDFRETHSFRSYCLNGAPKGITMNSPLLRGRVPAKMRPSSVSCLSSVRKNLPPLRASALWYLKR